MLLKGLIEASGLSGNEGQVRNLIIDEIKDHVDSIKVDRIGNIIAFKKGKYPDKKIMLAAHMDEVGLIVIDINDMGLLKFTEVGGLDHRILVSKRVLVGQDQILGVIGAKPIHLQKSQERNFPLGIDDLYIDIGATSKDEAEKLVSIGDYVMFQSDTVEFGHNLIKGKALDDRAGCSVIVDLLKEDNDFTFYGVFTVMEEIGLVGAGPAAYEVDPTCSIIVEGTICYEEPELDSHLVPTMVGKGPAISLMDRTTIYNKEFREKVVKTAEENSIPYQYRKSSMGGNDSGRIHTTRAGSITCGISVPCRNIHSPSSIMSLEDYENTKKLIRNILSKYNKGEF